MTERYSMKFIRTGLHGLFLFLVSMEIVADTGANPSDPKLLFEKMRDAQNSTYYSGSIVYERGDQLASYQVNSEETGQAVTQVLQSLSGPSKTLKVPNSLSCVEPVFYAAEALSDWYNFSYEGPTRVAGRVAHEIVLHPVDPYRLGHSYVVDQETGLMLKYTVTLPDKRVLEQMQFIDIALDTIDELQPASISVTGDSDQQIEVSAIGEIGQEPLSQQAEPDCEDIASDTPWRLGWAPEGFQQIKSSYDNQRSNFLYGDGLSMFSLFIEPIEELKVPAGNTRQGAITLVINYFSVGGNSFMATFVGELPLAAAEQILRNLRVR